VEHDKARNVLADYRQAVVDAGRERPTSVQRSDAVAALNSKIPAVNQVLRELAPDLPLIKATSLTQHRSARAILDKAEALLNAWGTLDDASAGESPALPLTMAA
jgi:CYTH domain-containing protein